MASALQNLQEANRHLRRMLEMVKQQESGRLQVTPEDLSELAKELKVREHLAKSARGRTPKLDEELDAYRHNLEQFLDALPQLQGRLLAERTRLEHERNHAEAAGLWAQSQSGQRRR